jgi:hypothetical protein
MMAMPTDDFFSAQMLPTFPDFFNGNLFSGPVWADVGRCGPVWAGVGQCGMV